MRRPARSTATLADARLLGQTLRRRLAPALAILVAALGLSAPVVVVPAVAVAAGPAVAVAAGPAASVAQGGSTLPSLSLNNAVNNSGAVPQAPAQPATQNDTSGDSGGGGLSGFDAILIAVIAVALIVGIWLFVVRDARVRTSRDPHVVDDPFVTRRKGSKAPPKSRKLTSAERRRRKRGRAPRRR